MKQNPEAKKRSPAPLVMAGAVLVSFTLSFFMGQSGILRLNQMQREYDNMLIENQRYAQENREMNREIYNLKHDPATIEKIAREEMHLVDPHDVVLLVPQTQPTTSEP